MRIAMWSGPRNLSTAMMYSFGARSDFAVVDEPFYASYLAKTGLDHPMRDEILASQPSDSSKVVDRLTGPIPGDMPHFYQKHMTQHMLPDVPRNWMAEFKNVFLIRHPARVVASYAAKRERPSLDDLGFRQQAEILETLFAMGNDPVVIDSYDIRRNPGRSLRTLCRILELEFDDAMLRWPAGGHADDGVWAGHWYGAVHKSTGFAETEGKLPKLGGELAELAASALPYYDSMAQKRLGARRR